MDQKPVITKDSPPDLIEQDIEAARKELSDTIDEIEERFSAEHWKAISRETIRAQADIAVSLGKELADRAGEAASMFGRWARERSREAGVAVVRYMKNNPGVAYIVAFELGAWSVIVLKKLRERKRKSAGTEYAKAKIMSIEEVERKVEEAATAPESEMKRAA